MKVNIIFKTKIQRLFQALIISIDVNNYYFIGCTFPFFKT